MPAAERVYPPKILSNDVSQPTVKELSNDGIALLRNWIRKPYGGFAFGTCFGFLIASTMPSSSGYVKSTSERLLQSLMMWGLLLLSVCVGYKTFIAGTDGSKPTHMFDLAKIQGIFDASQLKSTKSTEFSARPYEHYAKQLEKETSPSATTKAANPLPRTLSLPVDAPTSRRDSTPSLSSSVSTLSRFDSVSSRDSTSTVGTTDNRRSPSKSSASLRPKTKSQDAQQSFKPYDAPKGHSSTHSIGGNDRPLYQRSMSTSCTSPVKSDKSRSKERELASVPALSTRDPNRFSLISAYIRPDRRTVPVKLSGKGLSLRITTEGLQLDDDAGTKGGDLKTWMIESIEVGFNLYFKFKSFVC